MKGMVADPEECDMVCLENLHIATQELSECKSFCVVLRFQEELLKLKTIPNSLAVFCLATYGEGDPTDNAVEFYEWIQNSDPDMSGLNYAVSIIEFIKNILI